MKRARTVTKHASLLVAALVVLGCARVGSPEDLDAYLEDRMTSAGIPGMAVGVIRGGDLSYAGYFGYADIDRGRRVDEETVFMIASVSKTVTSAALMLLESRGEIDLDRSINDYLPFEISNPHHPERVITARMLLTHTSGIEDNWSVLDALYTIEGGGGDSPVGLERLIRGYLLPGGEYYDTEENFSTREPGTHHAYSNIGYALVGYLVQVVGEQDFAVFCEQEMFAPLGMDSSTWFLRDTDPAAMAVPYDFDESTPVPLPHYGYASYPDGQLRTTVADFARFLTIFVHPDGALLPAATVEEILRVQDGQSHRSQAIAWNYNETESVVVNMHLPRLPAHSGGDPGVSTFVMIDAERNSAVIVFTNGTPPRLRSFKTLYVDILKRLALEAGML